MVRICTSHFLAKWVCTQDMCRENGSHPAQAFQMWDFVVPLVLFFLFPDNFMPSATILFGNTLYVRLRGQAQLM